MRRGTQALLLAGAISALAAAPALALPTGYWDVARPSQFGCNCHDNGPIVVPGSPVTPTTVVRMFIDDQPLDTFGGYTPGAQHHLRVWVIGPIVPFVGFNLEATAGTLTPVDDLTQVRNDTECAVVKRDTFCGTAAKPCNVTVHPDCPAYDVDNDACTLCTVLGATCRPCDGVALISAHATHTEPSPLPYLDLAWTAPAEPVEVKFYIVGNSVSSSFGATLDFWNFTEPNPNVVHPAAP